MNSTYLGKVNTSLVHFLLLTVFGSVVTVFLVHKAEQALSSIDSFSDVSRYDRVFRDADQPAAINTATWKTYRNEKYGFEFKYPAGFSISPDSYNNLSIKDTSIIPGRFFDGILTIGPLRVRGGATLEIFVHNDAKYKFFKNLDYSDEHTELMNGITVYRYTKQTGPRSEKNAFFLLDRDYGVSASYVNIPGNINQTEQEFEMILSTFKFIK